MKTKIFYILLLAFFIRLVSINQSFWLDEATTATVVRDKNVMQILEFAKGDFHPPLYYLISKLWVQIIGLGEFRLRLLSVLFGVGTIYFVYKIGESLKNKTVGIISALLLALSGLHIYYSQEARMYSMAAFFVTAAVHYYLSASKKNKNMYFFSVAIALSILSDYLTIFVVPIFLLDAFYKRKKKINLKQFGFIIVPVFVALLLILPIFAEQLSSGLGVKGSNPLWWGALGTFNIKNIVLVPIKFMIGRVNFPKLIYVIVVALFGAMYSFLLINSQPLLKKNKIIFYWLIIPVLLGIIVSMFLPVLTYFRFLYVLPALYLILGSGVEGLKEKYFVPVFFVVIILNVFVATRYLFNDSYHREDWRGFVKFLSENKTADAKVVFVNNSQMEAVSYYYPEGDYGILEDKDFDRSELWLMRYVADIFDPEDKVRSKIEDSGFAERSEHNFRGVVVYKYEKEIN